MIIDLAKNEYQPGYLPRCDDDGLFHPFFPTANAAFRTEAIRKAGGFDPEFRTSGEDNDVCVRVAREGYELWYAPEARLLHHDRSTWKGLWKQWYGYGYYHPRLYRKHLERPRLRVYRFDQRQTPLMLSRMVDTAFPIYGMVYVGSFLIGHLALLALLLLWLLGAPQWTLWPAGAVWLGAVASYIKARFDLRRPWHSLKLTAVRYYGHLGYFWGGLMGSVRFRVLFLEACCSRPAPK